MSIWLESRSKLIQKKKNNHPDLELDSNPGSDPGFNPHHEFYLYRFLKSSSWARHNDQEYQFTDNIPPPICDFNLYISYVYCRIFLFMCTELTNLYLRHEVTDKIIYESLYFKKYADASNRYFRTCVVKLKTPWPLLIQFPCNAPSCLNFTFFLLFFTIFIFCQSILLLLFNYLGFKVVNCAAL